ncbi:Hypothetical predicted protein [Paramuricea clavata]|uniref:Uncharacterized protein n=1 Tax=Paramuricea clavata TaxID=317549 RepID=A0A7D9EHV1_PARCT|nr:Hypothetical predicted protein [Paramuricea clavata]
MEEANNEISQLQKQRRMRNCRKKRRRQERALANRMVNEEVLAQKISGAVKEQKALAEKYYTKWKSISKEANELRRKIPAQSHKRKVSMDTAATGNASLTKMSTASVKQIRPCELLPLEVNNSATIPVGSGTYGDCFLKTFKRFGITVVEKKLPTSDLKAVMNEAQYGLSRYLQGKQMDVVTAKKSVDAMIKTLSGCRTQENLDLLWSRAEIMADKIKELIEDTDFNFEDAKALVGETPEVNAQVEYRAAEDHYRITCYYLSIDKIVAEMKYRFEGNDQEVLLALADIVFSSSPTRENIELVSDFYGIDSELLGSEKNVFENIDANPERKNITKIVRMFENGVHEVLPVVYKVFSILATIPATSCFTERSFSARKPIFKVQWAKNG